jgi:hypothetical protein
MKAQVTITHKKIDMIIPIWDKVHLAILGDHTDLINLQDNLKAIKQHINSDMNTKGFALRDVDIKIDLIK